MNNTINRYGKPGLGVARVLSDSVTASFANFFRLLVLAVLAIVPGVVLLGLLGGTMALTTEALDLDFETALQSRPGPALVGLSLVFLGLMVVVSFFYAAAIRMFFGRKLGERLGMGTIILAGLRSAFRLAVVSLALALLVFVVFTALMGAGSGVYVATSNLVASPAVNIAGIAVAVLAFVLGIWLIGALLPVAAIAVIERRWLSALVRSFTLTKGYRWPLAGLFVLMLLLTTVLNAVGGLFLVVGPTNGIVALLVSFPFSLITTGIMVAAGTLAYVRLLEIKEGVTVAKLVDVFT